MSDHPYASPPDSTCNATDHIYYTSPTITTSQPLNNIMLTNINDNVTDNNNIYTTFDLTNIQQPIVTTTNTTSMTSIQPLIQSLSPQQLQQQQSQQQIPMNMMTSTPLYDSTQQEVYPMLNNNIPINNSNPNSPNHHPTLQQNSPNHNHNHSTIQSNDHQHQHHPITTTNNNNLSDPNVNNNNKMNQEPYILHLEKKLEDAKQLHTEYYFRIEQLMTLVEKQSIKIAELQDQLHNRQQ